MDTILIIFSSIAACMSLFMVMHIVSASKWKCRKGNALIFLMLALTLRISKSVFYFLLTPDISNWILFFGFFGFSLIGPSAYYYFALSQNNSVIRITYALMGHFILPIAGSLALFLFPSFLNTLYLLCLVSMGTYLAFIYWNIYILKVKNEKWDSMLFLGLGIILGVFVMPYFFDGVGSYAIGTAIASLVIYILFFLFLKHPPRRVPRNEKKYQIRDLQKSKVIRALEEERIYRDSSLSLHSFSEKVGIPQYIISQVTKEAYNKSFHSTINSLRIREVQQRLKDDIFDLKIEALAYDAGFNTVSAFYSAFKKETSLSPREYQRYQKIESTSKRKRALNL